MDSAFFQPLSSLHALSSHARPWPKFTDENFRRLGMQRVLEAAESGRAFLHAHGVRFEHTPGHSNYCAALQRERRRNVRRHVPSALLITANLTRPDRLAEIPELAAYDGFATDGHCHKAATPDARHDGCKLAVGPCYSLNLRTHTLRHLAAGEGWPEHDLSALKRITPRRLRQGVARGRRGWLVHDKAGIDFDYWQRCRKERAVYFLSRVKENRVYAWTRSGLWDRADARNHGVTDDRRATTREGHELRIVGYTDPVRGERIEFLTNVLALPPGVSVELYRRRWEAEKVFDEIKNKLGEKKAWAPRLEAKETPPLRIAITHNLLGCSEAEWAWQPGVSNAAEDRRRAKRAETLGQACVKKGTPLSTLVLQARRATQRSVKCGRWLRQSLRDHTAEAAAVLRLKALYANL